MSIAVTLWGLFPKKTSFGIFDFFDLDVLRVGCAWYGVVMLCSCFPHLLLFQWDRGAMIGDGLTGKKFVSLNRGVLREAVALCTWVWPNATVSFVLC